MQPSTLAALFGRDSRSERPALEDQKGKRFDAHWLRTSAWKAGNFLRHTGVRRGVTVGIKGEGPLALLACFGAGLLEGTVRFDPPRHLDSSIRTLVAPVDTITEYELRPETQVVGYGGAPDDPAVRHLEAGLWSENPSFPPLDIDPESPLLTDGTETYSHGEVCAAATQLVDTWELREGTRVGLGASLSDPRTVIGGVIAPLFADAVIVLSSDAPVDRRVGLEDSGDSLDGTCSLEDVDSALETAPV